MLALKQMANILTALHCISVNCIWQPDQRPDVIFYYFSTTQSHLHMLHLFADFNSKVHETHLYVEQEYKTSQQQTLYSTSAAVVLVLFQRSVSGLLSSKTEGSKSS